MPANGLTIGKDVSVVIRTSSGVQRFSYITGFDANPTSEDLKSTGLDGRTRHAVVHQGWDGDIDYDRDSDVFDAFWAQLEADFFAGFDTLPGSITETITEPGGGISVYRYDNVVFRAKKMGSKKGNELVKGQLGFSAETRIKVV